MTELPAGPAVRRLLRRLDHAALATASSEGAWPYVSLVQVATRIDGSPLLLLSGLAQHTRNLRADPRVSLLVDGTTAGPDRLAGARATVLGRAEATSEPIDRARFLARHPGAASYADFGDFAFYRIEVERAHLVAGFGRIQWVDAAEIVLSRQASAFLTTDRDAIEHMNADHADVVALFAERLLGSSGASWRLSGCDPEGCDLIAGGQSARLEFDQPATDPASLRQAFVALARRARADQEG